MASFAFEADHEIAKMMHASHRNMHLSIKRAQYLSSCNTMVGRRVGADVRPHRSARVATRTYIAKGAVEAHEDMPSIVCMNSEWSRRRCARKPCIAPLVKYAEDDDVEDSADATTDDEGADKWLSGEETESPQESPAFRTLVTPDQASECDAWPSLSHSTAEFGAEDVNLTDKRSHCEVAIQGMLLAIEEEACLSRLRVRKMDAARAAKKSLSWKKVARKRAHRTKKNVQQIDGSKVEKSALPEAMAPSDLSADVDGMKVARASARAKNLHIKRSKVTTYCDTTTFGRRVGDGVKPHRRARVAARARLAMGAVESQEDMPSIVCMNSEWSRRRRARQPAIARMLQHGNFDDVYDEAVCDENLGTDAISIEKSQMGTDAISIGSSATEEFEVVDNDKKTANDNDKQAANKRTNCVIS